MIGNAAAAHDAAESSMRDRVSFVKGDMRNWPAPGDAFDAVVIACCGALAERLVANFASHVYFPAELDLLFVSAGFEIAKQYGDYRFVPRDRTSEYVVTVARRPRHSARRPFRRGPLRHNASPHPVNGL
jgi:hypothetical protein